MPSSQDLCLRLTTTLDNTLPRHLYDNATISGDGAYVWITHTYAETQPLGAPAATLYSNEGGLLARIGEVPPNDQLNTVSNGAISRSGTFAFVVDEGVTFGQIRTFNIPESTPIRTISLPNVSNPHLLMVATNEIFFDRYTTVTYPTNQGQDFVVAVVDLLTGSVVTTPIQGFSNTAGYLFKIEDRLYLAVTSTVVDQAGERVGPAFLQLFVTWGDRFVQVVQTLLPSIANDLSIQVRHGTALIAVALNGARVPGVPPLYDQTTIFNPTGEPGGIWLFTFDGCQLELAALKTINSGTIGARSLTFDPTGRFLLATLRNANSASLSTLVTYRLVAGHNRQLDRITSVPISCRQLLLKEIDVNLTTPVTVSIQFDEAGRWLIVSGGTFDTEPRYPTVNLFRVHS